jgi:hypothetical protein
MSNPDWDNAPEGATQYVVGSIYPWEKIVAGVLSYFNGSEWLVLFTSAVPRNLEIVQRPTAWDGKGLPPVGTVCEYLDAVMRWEQVRITGHAELGICFRTPIGNGECYVSLAATFRPIRTPEQIAADEREAAVADMLGLFGSTHSRDTFVMQRLYDAGYRKP